MKTPKARRANDAIAIVTYGDHEVITPENRLRGAVSTNTAGEPHDDPVARAEKALAELSCKFGSWMDSECDRLDKAHRDFAKDAAQSKADALFHAATTSRVKRRRSGTLLSHPWLRVFAG